MARDHDDSEYGPTGDLRIAAAVSPGGRVVATDLSPSMGSATEVRATTAGADNVEVASARRRIDITARNPDTHQGEEP